MQELTDKIREASKLTEEKSFDPMNSDDENLRVAAEKWAIYCLRTYDTYLLDSGLKISKYIIKHLNRIDKDTEEINME